MERYTANVVFTTPKSTVAVFEPSGFEVELVANLGYIIQGEAETLEDFLAVVEKHAPANTVIDDYGVAA
jgi:hypothetical protein